MWGFGGCRGSLSSWLSYRWPASRIACLSNSHGQREYILARAKERVLHNLTILTCNIDDFEMSEDMLEGKFDRVLSIEMFEHMKNYGLLFAKISRWIKPSGKLFVHVFAHKLLA